MIFYTVCLGFCYYTLLFLLFRYATNYLQVLETFYFWFLKQLFLFLQSLFLLPFLSFKQLFDLLSLFITDGRHKMLLHMLSKLFHFFGFNNTRVLFFIFLSLYNLLVEHTLIHWLICFWSWFIHFTLSFS